MLDQYQDHCAQRTALGLPPQALDAATTTAVVAALRSGQPAFSQGTLVELLTHRVPPGVDEAARIKANFLAEIAQGGVAVDGLTTMEATRLLGTMLGGFNVSPLVRLLDSDEVGDLAVEALRHTMLVYDAFHDVVGKADQGHARALRVLRSWAEADWFTTRAAMTNEIEIVVFKVPGETTTDDLSPATEIATRVDIPLHATCMLKNPHAGVQPDIPGVRGPLRTMGRLRAGGRTLVYAGDLVGTGSSRKSAVNSLQWHMGEDIAYIPNRRQGGICLSTQFAPIFFSTVEDSGGLPVTIDVSPFETGDLLTMLPHQRVLLHGGRELPFELAKATLLDSVRAGGRIALIVGRRLTDRARDYVGSTSPTVFVPSAKGELAQGGYTLAQKLVGRACGLPDGQGVRPGTYCEPHVDAVASPDDSGPMTRSELKDLACLGFSADLVLQSFCHTSAYPSAGDLQTQREVSGFMRLRGAVVLRPDDGIVHAWLNRMLLPDRLGTGADSHSRFPLGISFPAGSGMVAFAAATGVMPMEMPESVLVRFVGKRRPGITIRDLVHAIPLFAQRSGLLTLKKKNKVNVFNGRILEFTGLPDLSVQEAFELTDASAERSACAAAIELEDATVRLHVQNGVELLRELVAAGYEHKPTLTRRIAEMERWLDRPAPLLRASEGARYAAVLEIDLAQVTEPVVCCPNDPDDARFLSDAPEEAIDEVFLGSCMTNAEHFRRASRILRHQGVARSKLWIAPPTRMDKSALHAGGETAVFHGAGARQEQPGCSLCMGNQARVRDGASVVSTSTRNYPNRMGLNARVYLASAEVASLTACLGRLPSAAEYFAAISSTHGQGTRASFLEIPAS